MLFINMISINVIIVFLQIYFNSSDLVLKLWLKAILYKEDLKIYFMNKNLYTMLYMWCGKGTVVSNLETNIVKMVLVWNSCCCRLQTCAN